MAQLDILSYFTQLFWLTLVISFFYIIILKRVLPNLKRIFKIRALTIDLNKINVSESKETSKEDTKLMINSLNIVNKNLKELTQLNHRMVTENLKGKNHKNLMEANQVYVNSITKLLLEK